MTFLEKEQWAALQRVVGELNLPYLECLLAQQLLANQPEASTDLFAFILFLLLAAKAGHVCAWVSEEQLLPHPEQLWREQEIQREPAAGQAVSLERFCHAVVRGAQQVTPQLCTHLEQPGATFKTPIGCFQGRYYTQRNWLEETLLLRELRRLQASEPTLKTDVTAVFAQTEALLQSGASQPEQAAAIRMACQQALTFITGGPGTGKTYTAGQFMRIFSENLTEAQRVNCQVVVAAPTGKAAAHLEASLRRMGATNVKAQTLHALLKLGYQRKRVADLQPLPADLLLIDEASMIDLDLMAGLLASVKTGARLIILGDQYQLSSIETGNTFADLLRCHPSHAVCLKKCLRAESQHLVLLAEAIRTGNSEEALSRCDLQDLEADLHTQAVSYFSCQTQDPARYFDSCQKFRLLSPLRKGPYGVEAINAQLFSACTKDLELRMAPILITKNDYAQGLFNGDAGILVGEEYALIQTSEGLKQFPAALLPSFDYAYCLSVHKSQGSEFDTVWLAMLPGSEVFGRQMLYTAATRAKRELKIFSSEETLERVVKSQHMRVSGIGCG